MYCTQCGYNNPVSVKFCKNCEVDLQPSTINSDLAKNPEVLIYAGFRVRFIALFLDALVLVSCLILIIFSIAGFIALSGRDSILHKLLAAPIFYGVIAGLSAAYFALMESGPQGGTFGKRWMNIKVMDSNGNRLTATRAWGRLFARLVSHLSLYIGYLIQPFTPRKQALHDLLARTVVVRANDSKKISVMASLLVLFFALMVPVLALFSTAGLPFFQQYILKVQLDKGIQTGLQTTTAVARFYAANGRVPTALSEGGGYNSHSPHVAAIDINQQNGELTLTFSETVRKVIRNKHLLFTPAQGADLSISWKCHSADIEAQYLPANCK